MTALSRFPTFQPDFSALDSIDNPAENELQLPHGHGHANRAALSLTQLMSGRAVDSFKNLTASQQASVSTPWLSELEQKRKKQIDDAKKTKKLPNQAKKVVPRALMS